MPIEIIKKRNGDIVTFDRAKIEIAIGKAYNAMQTAIETDDVSLLTDQVIQALEASYVDEADLPDVESIQDVVEKQIADRGDFEVARAYVVYRREHAKLRDLEEQHNLEKVERQELSVTKRNGKKERLDIAQIEIAIKNACNGNEADVDVDEIIAAVKRNLYDGIKTSEINHAVVMAMKAFIERDPVYSFITARFLINDLYKDVIGVDTFDDGFDTRHREGFINAIREGVEKKRLDKRLLDFDLKKLAGTLDADRDKLFAYMGIQVLHDRYFVRDSVGTFLETTQYFWMRIAMGLSILEKDKNQAAIDFYNTISRMYYVPSTPTLLHAGTTHPQMSSCYLSTVEDDLAHIFKVVGDNAQLSKYSGGIGNDWTNIRATNALVKTTNTPSQGLIPFLKIIDATTASINRSGKRRGAACMYLETWHLDIEDYLDLRKNTGDERRRTHDINTANWIPDLFMQRVMNGDNWTLFSPEEVPDLHTLYGRAFKERYEEYERMADTGEIKLFKRLPAEQLWRKMITMLFSTGHPWFTFKDPSNIRSPQDHVGVVKCSNLCTEITLNTSAEETAVCNLGSINLPRHLKSNGEFDKEHLAETVTTAIRMLDNVIDLNFYPTKEAETSNLRHRPVGLGIMGYQDVLYRKRLQFNSDEAVQLSDEIMEFVSYYAILASAHLAKEKGTYSTFKGSKWDRNLLPVDTIALLESERGMSTGVSKSGLMDWNPVREAIKKHGMRNSNCLAIAPTATIANISGCLPSIEPIYKNLYVKSNFSGEFTVLNYYLVQDLKKLGLWNDEMLEKIKHYDGSVQNISGIPTELKDLYKEVFELDALWIVRHGAHRQKWIDQSQSVNIFTSSSSGKYLSDIYFDAWRMGMKTTYYLRSMGATAVEKSTLDINKNFADEPKDTQPQEKEPELVTAGKPKLHVYTDDTCESCQ